MTHNIYEELGPAGRRWSRILTVLSTLAIASVLVYGGGRLRDQGIFESEHWSILGNTDLLTLMLKGLKSTLAAGLLSAVLSLIVGAILVFVRLSEIRWARAVAVTIIEICRGLPPLLFIFFIFLGFPAIGIPTSTFWTLVVGLTCYNAPAVAEIYRAGIEALPKGQSEAGSSIGLTRLQNFRHIILPQAIPPTVPAIIGQLVMLLKETALGFIIGYEELLRRAQGSVEFLGGDYAIPIYTLVAVIYVAMCLSLSGVAMLLARKWRPRFRTRRKPESPVW